MAIKHPPILRALIDFCTDGRALRDAIIGAAKNWNGVALHILIRKAPIESLNTPSERGTPLTAVIDSFRDPDHWVSNLLRKGADPNIIGVIRTPLHLAIFGRRMRTALLLLKNGADFRIVARDGSVPFVDAYRYPTLMREMIEMGAAMDQVDAKGLTAAMKSVAKEDFESLSFLIDHGADLGGCPGYCCHDAIKDFLQKYMQ